MDKRNWIFFLYLLIVTLLVNQYFSPKISLEKEDLESSRKARVIKILQEKESKSPVSLHDLSIQKVFTKDQKSSFYGVEIDGSILSIANSLSMPKEIFLKNQPLELAFTNASLEPILYQKSSKKISLDLPVLSEGALFYLTDLSDNTSEPKVVLATIQKKDLITSVPLKKDSLAFNEQKKLVGVYEAKTAKIRSFQEYFRLAKLVTLNAITDENYYVLESPYQMLVFSTKGGALAEINLPFEDENHPNSVVKEIEVDRLMQENHPENDRFPENSYFVVENGTVVEKDPQEGSYYPLLRRDLIKKEGKNQIFPSQYYACSLGGEDLGSDIYQVTRFEKNLIEFQSSQPRRSITKRYSFPENPNDVPYLFDLTIEIEGDQSDLYLQTGIPEVELVSGYFSPTLKYLVQKHSSTQVDKLSLPKATQFEENVSLQSVSSTWIVNSNGFLGLIIDPIDYQAKGLQTKAIPGEDVPTRLSLIDAKYGLYPAKNYSGYLMGIPLSQKNSMSYRVFAGPFATTVLEKIDSYYGSLSKDPEYTKAQSYHGWFSFISAPFAKFLSILIQFFHRITGSWGISIILLTLFVNLLLYPLTSWSIKSMKRSEAIRPEIDKIQQKYKKDPKKLQMEIMKLYKERGVNPLTGCFPQLIKLPFLFGMFDLLKSTFSLRGASFIPGWIDNLAAPDVLFSWGYPIFFFGTSFHLLPIILGGLTYLQQKLTMKKNPDEPLTEQDEQKKMMMRILPFILIFFFYNLPSGLSIYWIFSTIFGMIQQYFTNKKIGLNASGLPKKP